jgi:hypothetical protein
VKRGFFLLLAIATAGCFWRSSGAASPPAFLLGRFGDDYGVNYEISATTWRQLPRGEYHIVRWNTQERYAIARNAMTNSSAPGLWTRIDWVELTGMAPYEWAFCYSAYQAPTEAVAETVSVARKETPRTGCNGFPFSRMRRVAANDTR